MGLRDKLKSRAVERVEVPSPASPTDDGWTPFERAYGRPDPARLRQATTYTFLTGAEAEAALAKPLTEAQIEGVRVQARTAGLDAHTHDATQTAADDVLARAEALVRRQRGE